jgi:hypothetical protein
MWAASQTAVAVAAIDGRRPMNLTGGFAGFLDDVAVSGVARH